MYGVEILRRIFSVQINNTSAAFCLAGADKTKLSHRIHITANFNVSCQKERQDLHNFIHITKSNII